MTSTLRAQLARSRQAQSGAKRVEVVLDAKARENLCCLMLRHNLNQSQAVIEALAIANHKVPLEQADSEWAELTRYGEAVNQKD
jgi:hypothetical protein